jgi:Kdo2-lipid IVA lauroyltransferase/acyltransferase
MRDRLLHGTAFWAWRVGAILAQGLPSWVTYPAAVIGGEIAYVFWTSRRRVAKQNFAIVLDRQADDPEVARVARRSFRNFAKYLVEIMRFPRLEVEDLERIVAVDPRSWAHLHAAREHGRGLIFVSMHFGNFEMGGARIADEMPLNVIADELENQRLMDLLVSNRAHKNVKLLPPAGAVRQVLQALRRNEMVGLMMDLGPRARELDHIQATFFGERAAFPTIAANLARVSGAPIVVAAVMRQRDNTFRGVALPPIFVERTKQAAHDIERATQAIVHGLEQLVRGDPDQWYIFRPMWNRTEGATP